MNKHWPASGPAAMAGALKFPAFLLVWSVGLVIATGAVRPADALTTAAPPVFAALPAVPSVGDAGALALALDEQLLAESAVVSGAWQPKQAPTRLPPLIEPQLIVKAPAMVKRPVAVLAEAQPPLPPTAQKPPEADKPIDASEKFRKVPSSSPMPKLSPASGAALAGKRSPRSEPDGREALGARATLVLQAAQLALAEGRHGQAHRLLMGQVQDAARHPAYLGALAVSALALGRNAEALIVYERLTELAPDDGRWWAGAALSRERLGLDAKAQFETALALAQGDEVLTALASSRLEGFG